MRASVSEEIELKCPKKYGFLDLTVRKIRPWYKTIQIGRDFPPCRALRRWKFANLKAPK